MKKLIGIILLILFFSCKSEKYIYENNRFNNIEKFNIKRAIKFEEKRKATNTTPEHKVSLEKGIYPNTKEIKLETPISYEKNIQGNFVLETKYFYSKSDSLVKVILYQWTNPSFKDFMSELKIDKKKNKEKFENKFKLIEREIIKILGNPDIANHNQDQFPYTRNDRKWLKNKKTKAYLFKGNHEPSGNYHIELAIYSE